LANLGQRAIQRIPVTLIAPDLRPSRRQARLLPLPEELEIAGAPAPGYADLVAELRELGQSLKERQIQPIVVYAGASAEYPEVRHLILVGHRRWTAARLAGLDALDAIVVDEPALADRVLIQYAENEAREEFSDMERAWSLLQMKQALGDAPWEAVEARMQLSRARRQQLLRLTAFPLEQQQQIARLRLQETQVRTLHSALRAGELTPDQAESVLCRLDAIAAERQAAAPPADTDDTLASAPPRRVGIDGPTVARLVARAQKSKDIAAPPRPRWLAPLQQSMQQARAGLERAAPRVGDLDEAALGEMQVEVGSLLSALETMVATLAARERAQEEGEV
jgi:ParB family chromosome partitioning protein